MKTDIASLLSGLIPASFTGRRDRTTEAPLDHETALPRPVVFEAMEPRLLLSTTFAVSSGDWDNASTWSDGVPDDTTRAIVSHGQTVTVRNNAAAEQVVVHGVLDVAEDPGASYSLTTDWVHVNSGGVFQIGTEADRFDQADFTLTLTGTDPDADYTVETATGTMQINDNDGFLMAAGGGRLLFFGEEKLTFSKLSQTANAGVNMIFVENVIERNFDGTTSAASDGQVDWAVGDQIVIASSSRDYDDQDIRTITGITTVGDTKRITLNSALSHRHYGEIETYGNGTRTWDIDMRAEVALLNRNVVVTGLASQDTDNNWGDRALYNGGSTGDHRGVGGHIMIMETAGQVSVEGVQLDRLGQTGTLGRYPIHWHVAGDRSGDVLKGVSITNSNSRGVTVHGTHNLLIQDVVLHDIHGHGFFMEDAVETGNTFLSNIAFGIHKVGRSAAVGNFAPDLNDPFIVDTHDHVGQNANRFLSSAGFWMTNPDNTWVGNISAGSEGTGFWFLFPEQAIGLSASDPQYNNTNARRTNMRLFEHNTAHASPVGFNYDRGPDILVPVGAPLMAFFDGQTWLPPNEPQLSYTTAYQTRIGIYHRGLIANFHENRFADNFTSTFITFTQRITDTLYVGHSQGNSNLSDRVTGHTLYDGANTLDGTHFAGFADNDAHTFRTHSAALRHTHHVMTNTSFEDDGSAFNVSISNQEGGANHPNATNQFTPSAVYDADGTLTGHVGGGPGSTVVSNHPFFYDSNDFRPSGWNAWVSDDLYSLFFVDANNNNADIRFTSPDGDSSTGSGVNSKTVVKLDAGDYTLSFPEGLGSISSGFDVKFYVRVGPSQGSTVTKFTGIADTLTLSNAPRVGNLTTLRNANSTVFARDGDDLWVNFFSSPNDVRFVPGTNPVSLDAVDDTATTRKGDPVTIDVLDNDTGTSLQVSLTGPTSAAGAAVSTDGSQVFYNPGSLFDHLVGDQTATDTFTYAIIDGNNVTDTATVTVTITANLVFDPLAFSPTDDAYIQNGFSFNDAFLKVQNSGLDRTSYLKFDVTGLGGAVVTSATLRLNVNGDAGSGAVSVHAGSHNTWTETTLTDANKPAAGVVIDTVSGTHGLGQWREFDVTQAVGGEGQVSFVVQIAAGSNDVWFSSSEGAAPPELIVEVAAAVPLAGDYNGSGSVEQGDLDLVLQNWGQLADPAPAGWVQDFLPGIIAQAQLDRVLQNWGNTAAPSAVPGSVELTPVATSGLAQDEEPVVVAALPVATSPTPAVFSEPEDESIRHNKTDRKKRQQQKREQRRLAKSRPSGNADQRADQSSRHRDWFRAVRGHHIEPKPLDLLLRGKPPKEL